MVLELVTAFTLGILSTSNPCAIPLYPGFIAYLARGPMERAWRSLLGLAVVSGVLTSMLVIGMVLNLLSVSLGRLLTLVTPIVATVIAIFGLLMIFNVNPWHRLQPLTLPPMKNPFLTAFAYGTLYGPISLPCIAPLLLSVFASSLLLTETLSRFIFFFVFGLGLSLPLLIIAVLSDTVGEAYVRYVRVHHQKLMILAGLLLIAVAIYSYIAFFTYGIYFI